MATTEIIRVNKITTMKAKISFARTAKRLNQPNIFHLKNEEPSFLVIETN
jgi:hypothetical protein